MTYQRTTIGLRLGLALGTAIALLGVAIGVAIAGATVASIPAANGQISACYKTSNGAVRIIDSSKTCVTGEKLIRWNQTGPPGPAGPATIVAPCSAGDSKGSLSMVVDPVGGAVSWVCKASLTVTSTMTLTKISISAGAKPGDEKVCLNTKSCTGAFPLGTANVVAQFFGTAPFHYICPTDIAQGNYYDVTHTITVGQCTVPSLSTNSTIPVTP